MNIFHRSRYLLGIFLACSIQLATHSSAAQSPSVPFGTIEMGIRSRSPKPDYNGTTDRFVMDLLSVTVYFLDKAMKDYFVNNNRVQFQRVSATFQGYDMREDDGSVQDATPHYEATVTLTGNAIFEVGYVADQDLVVAIVKEAFTQDHDGFLKRLWVEAGDPFLHATSSIFVNVTDNYDNSAGDSQTNNQDNDTNTSAEQQPKLAGWLIVLIAGGGAFCVVFVTCITCVCATEIDEIPAVQEPPAKSKSTASGETDDEESRYGEVSEVNPNTNFGTNAQCSPSTVRSLTSQDSSIFTYNPKSVKSYTSNGSKTYGSGFFTANSGLDMDLQAWQNGGTVIKDENQAPFGHDISAITSKKDLSLIEEEDLNDLSGRMSSSTQQYFKTPSGAISPRQYLTEAAVQDLELPDRWGSRNRNTTSQMESFSRDITNLGKFTTISSTGSISNGKNNISRSSIGTSRSSYSVGLSGTSKLDLEGSTSDVINELNDLSYQIDAYRQRTTNN